MPHLRSQRRHHTRPRPAPAHVPALGTMAWPLPTSMRPLPEQARRTHTRRTTHGRSSIETMVNHSTNAHSANRSKHTAPANFRERDALTPASAATTPRPAGQVPEATGSDFRPPQPTKPPTTPRITAGHSVNNVTPCGTRHTRMPKGMGCDNHHSPSSRKTPVLGLLSPHGRGSCVLCQALIFASCSRKFAL